MDQTPKLKIHSRRKKKNDRKSHGLAKGRSVESPRDARQSEQETPVKATGSKTITDLHSCYQFIDSEPVIIWGSPHVSPSYELRAKQVCISTPQHRPKDRERFQKPMRRLIKGTHSPSQFLRELVDFSEQFKSEKVDFKEEPGSFVDYSCSTEEPLSVEVSGADLSDTNKFLPLSPQYRACPEELEQIKEDCFQALFDDGDDDIMLKCSQEIEDIICTATNPETMSTITREQAVLHERDAVTPVKKGDKLTCLNEGIELTPKKDKKTESVAGPPGKERRSAVNRSARDLSSLHSKNAFGSENRRSPRLKGGTVKAPEESLYFGCESFEDVLKMMVEEDFPDPSESSQSEVSTLSPQRVIEWKLKNDKRTKTVSKRAGGSSSKKDGRSVPRCKRTVVGEKRKSVRHRGSTASDCEQLPDFGCKGFQDVPKGSFEDSPDASDSPQRKVELSDSARRSRSNAIEVGRRKGFARSAKGGADGKGTADRNQPKSDILEYFRCKEEDLNESDLVRALDVVEYLSCSVKSKDAIRSEKRKSPRSRGGTVRVDEDFEILKRSFKEEADASDSPQRKVRQSEPAVEVGRRKGTPRSARGAADNGKRAADRNQPKSAILEFFKSEEAGGANGRGAVKRNQPKSLILEYFRSEEVDLNDSDLVKALDVVESQTVQSSPPFKCTPEEILQKKLEAKRRLAKKKLSRCKGTVPSTFLRPKR